MFSKHVWYDTRHQAEVFLDENGEVSGTIVAYEGTVFVVNPHPEILTALYHEAKMKRILSLGGVVLTDSALEHTRGLCALVNYSRGLRRKRPLLVISRRGGALPTAYLNSACSQILRQTSQFPVTIQTLGENEPFRFGKGTISFLPYSTEEADASVLAIRTERGRLLHYLDEGCGRAGVPPEEIRNAAPHLVIRAMRSSDREFALEPTLLSEIGRVGVEEIREG